MQRFKAKCEAFQSAVLSGASTATDPFIGVTRRLKDARGRRTPVVNKTLSTCGLEIPKNIPAGSPPPPPAAQPVVGVADNRKNEKCESFEAAVANGSKTALSPLTNRIVKLRDANGRLTATANRLLKVCGATNVNVEESKCTAFYDLLRSGAREAVNPMTGRKMKLFDAKGRVTSSAAKIVQECGMEVPGTPSSIRAAQCKEFRDLVSSGAARARNPFTGRTIQVRNSKGDMTSAAAGVMKMCMEFATGAVSIQSMDDKCGAFQTLVNSGVQEAVNPMTGRKIKIYTAKGKMTKTASKILEQCSSAKN